MYKVFPQHVVGRSAITRTRVNLIRIDRSAARRGADPIPPKAAKPARAGFVN
jgi:hypothetical protein